MKARDVSKRPIKHVALSDWRELQGGEFVSILKDAKRVAQGRVEEVSGSGGVLWLVDEGFESRTFFKSDGIHVRRL